MNTKIQLVVGAGLVLVVAVSGIFLLQTKTKIPTAMPVVSNEFASSTSQVATSSQETEDTTIVSTKSAQPNTEEKYENPTFGYTFTYPTSWALAPEKSLVDSVNDMPSIVSVYEQNVLSPHRFTVTINRKERALKESAEKTETVTVAGQSVTAYIFPRGYTCVVKETDPDCSFFLIPIQHNGIWYEINAANDAASLDYYRTILSSFVFTQ